MILTDREQRFFDTKEKVDFSSAKRKFSASNNKFSIEFTLYMAQESRQHICPKIKKTVVSIVEPTAMASEIKISISG
jgi:hypothetical protein